MHFKVKYLNINNVSHISKQAQYYNEYLEYITGGKPQRELNVLKMFHLLENNNNIILKFWNIRKKCLVYNRLEF